VVTSISLNIDGFIKMGVHCEEQLFSLGCTNQKNLNNSNHAATMTTNATAQAPNSAGTCRSKKHPNNPINIVQIEKK